MTSISTTIIAQQKIEANYEKNSTEAKESRIILEFTRFLSNIIYHNIQRSVKPYLLNSRRSVYFTLFGYTCIFLAWVGLLDGKQTATDQAMMFFAFLFSFSISSFYFCHNISIHYVPTVFLTFIGIPYTIWNGLPWLNYYGVL